MNAAQLRRALEAGEVVAYQEGIGRHLHGRIVRVDAPGGAPARVDLELVTGGHIHGVSAARITRVAPDGDTAA